MLSTGAAFKGIGPGRNIKRFPAPLRAGAEAATDKGRAAYGLSGGHRGISCNRLSNWPVSYTHLDVYKRQPFAQVERYNRIFERRITNEVRVPFTRWVALRYPTPSMAQSAGMNTEDFEDFFFKVCNMDYRRMSRAMDPFQQLMEKTDRVRIVGPNTDLRFSIKGCGAVKCDGSCNIPDGEVYSAPVRDSVEGYITYNTPSLVDGFTFENIHFEFSKGKIVKATANDSRRLNEILDTDEGARYVGEFAFGVNPYINRVMNDTLFDEKIGGSIHFTPGNCAMGCHNGNKSQVHWDIVLIQTPEWGGGEIYFDDALIRKDGRFVLPELTGLNPENLA